MLLGRPWLKLSNAVTDWAKGCITYGSRDNRTKMITKPRNSKRAEHKIDSSSDSSYNSNEETDGDANDSYYTKEEKQKNEDGVGPLKCLGPGLYGWEGNDEFVE